MVMNNEWEYKEICISQVETLLDNGYEVEVDSPDGYVKVDSFVNKGFYDEYVFVGDRGNPIRCNGDHLFETTTIGWVSAWQMYHSDREYTVIGRDGPIRGKVHMSGDIIPIVDISVDHPNHRYYTEQVSSHNTGVGKTLFMTHCASANLSEGKNVLYITMEMAEERIAERIDANLLDLTVDELKEITHDVYVKRITRVKNKTAGKLIIKEYPTASAGSGHFRHLLNELRLKKNFVPDIVYIDYLNICTSSRIRNVGSVNSYTLIKAIAEELRGLAVEFNIPIVSATQTTRSGYQSSDLDLSDTSECIFVDEMVTLRDGSQKKIGDISLGDQITSHDDYKTVMMVHHKKTKPCVRIKLKSGKTIVVSKDHIFPTSDGRKCVNTGLSVGDKLKTR